MIDTHIHLDFKDFEPDLEAVLENARLTGVRAFIIPGADIKTLPRAIEIAQNNKGVYFAVGIHPNDIKDFDEDALEKFITHEKCVAVGECGLDYFYTKEYKEEQEKYFRYQLELALEHNLPVILHVRDAKTDFEASTDMARILRDYPTIKGVFHCFNANPLLLDFQENFYYGIGGVSTFKNALNLQEVIANLDSNKILLETDAPFLAPTPYRGQRNESKYLDLIALKVASLKKLEVKEVVATSTQNALNLFHKVAI
ncbi:TatD family hydrolase [Helicobacter sp. 11S02629-2]|uniref:TatD family hydrolase n=1 Tax=Helicobacter sp. 11S02629-2 TaxID=1476195 RepID=UPI000BA5CB4A|nr:TatD family hydrolase [Helicobacter sp. 11S02629-2]PAF45642.1 hydrolase TatD [Helicobacter sp. 11S02629-2]